MPEINNLSKADDNWKINRNLLLVHSAPHCTWHCFGIPVSLPSHVQNLSALIEMWPWWQTGRSKQELYWVQKSGISSQAKEELVSFPPKHMMQPVIVDILHLKSLRKKRKRKETSFKEIHFLGCCTSSYCNTEHRMMLFIRHKTFIQSYALLLYRVDLF